MYIGPVPLIFPTHFFNRENFKTDGCFVLVIKTNAGFGDAFQWKKVLVTKTNIWTFRRNSLLQATTDVHSIIIRFFLSQWFLNCFKNYWLILEREKNTNFVVPVVHAFTGWFLYVPWLGIEPTTLASQDNAPNSWATQAGLSQHLV